MTHVVRVLLRGKRMGTDGLRPGRLGPAGQQMGKRVNVMTCLLMIDIGLFGERYAIRMPITSANAMP
ncbi:hypothetical protein DRB87_05675 [Pandoraea sp. XY-2]|nr:hypothetical protein DRB87_05675 [Pandoraea sp. XY-2]